MTPAEIQRMKEQPGLHTVAFPADGTVLVVASIDGKLYAMVADQELSDEGWDPDTHLRACIHVGVVGRVGER